MVRSETAGIRYARTKTMNLNEILDTIRETMKKKKLNKTTGSLDETLNTIQGGETVQERDGTTMLQYEAARIRYEMVRNLEWLRVRLYLVAVGCGFEISLYQNWRMERKTKNEGRTETGGCGQD